MMENKEAATLPVMEHFYTIQGEGYYQGKAAYFIRFAGCDVGCSWCDVKESWDAAAHPRHTVAEITDFVTDENAQIAVITGGEPAMYDLAALTKSLQEKNIRTHIETSGVYPLRGNFDWITVSPKRFKLPLVEVLNTAHELKIVIAHRNDLRWAESFIAKVNSDCRLYLQPEWDEEDEMLPLIINYVKENPHWQISLQVHKYMNIP